MTRGIFTRGVGLIDIGGALAVAAVSALGYWIALRPVLMQRETQHAQATKLQSLRTAVEDGAKMKEKAEVTLAKLQRELAGCEVQLQAASTLNARLAELGELAARSGLVVQSMRGDDAKVSGQRVQVPIKMVARGSYPAIGAFFRTLATTYRDTAVERFSASADRSDKQGGDGAFWVDITWFAVSDGAGDVATVPAP